MSGVIAAPGLHASSQPSLLVLLGVFTRMGLASFGGGLPGWMHREVVEKRGWMTNERFLAGVAVGQILPGGNSVNLALYIGQQLRGGPGLIVCGFGVLFPPVVMIVLLATAYGYVESLTSLQFVMSGLAAAGVGMTTVIGVTAARKIRAVTPAALAIVTFVLIGVLRLPMLPVVLCLAPLSIVLAWRRTEQSSDA